MRQGLSKIFVFAAPEVMARHHHAAAKAVLIVIHSNKGIALVRLQYDSGQRVSVVVETGFDLLPIKSAKSCSRIVGCGVHEHIFTQAKRRDLSVPCSRIEMRAS